MGAEQRGAADLLRSGPGEPVRSSDARTGRDYVVGILHSQFSSSSQAAPLSLNVVGTQSGVLCSLCYGQIAL